MLLLILCSMLLPLCVRASCFVMVLWLVIWVISSFAIISLSKICGPKIIKPFSFSAELSMKFIMLINVKMPTIVVIFTFISMINTISEKLKARKVFILQHFRFFKQLKIHAQLSWAWQKSYYLETWLLWQILSCFQMFHTMGQTTVSVMTLT